MLLGYAGLISLLESLCAQQYTHFRMLPSNPEQHANLQFLRGWMIIALISINSHEGLGKYHQRF